MIDQSDFMSDVACVVKAQQSLDERTLTEAAQESLAETLARASVHWPVIPDRYGEGFLLAWNDGHAPVENGDIISPDDLGRLTRAVIVLAEAGIDVTLGKSL